MPLLTQNSELRPHRIWNWTIPAWYANLPSGKFITCPHAGACARVCYARNGTYLFSNVLAAHNRNLQRYLDNPDQLRDDLHTELASRKFRPTGTPRDLPIPYDAIDLTMRHWASKGGAAVRIHDAGDFFNDDYLRFWIGIAEHHPDILFYAYTKEVVMFREHRNLMPANFRYLYSTGGTQDHLINPDQDRHADVFPDTETLTNAGYQDQSANDLLAILLPTTRIGIPANNIRHFNKHINGRTFSQMTRDFLRMPNNPEGKPPTP